MRPPDEHGPSNRVDRSRFLPAARQLEVATVERAVAVHDRVARVPVEILRVRTVDLRYTADREGRDDDRPAARRRQDDALELPRDGFRLVEPVAICRLNDDVIRLSDGSRVG